MINFSPICFSSVKATILSLYASWEQQHIQCIIITTDIKESLGAGELITFKTVISYFCVSLICYIYLAIIKKKESCNMFLLSKKKVLDFIINFPDNGFKTTMYALYVQ